MTTDYDHAAGFAQYKTYSWIQAKAQNSLWEDRIMRDAGSQLAAKGLTKVSSPIIP